MKYSVIWIIVVTATAGLLVVGCGDDDDLSDDDVGADADTDADTDTDTDADTDGDDNALVGTWKIVPDEEQDDILYIVISDTEVHLVEEFTDLIGIRNCEGVMETVFEINGNSFTAQSEDGHGSGTFDENNLYFETGYFAGKTATRYEDEDVDVCGTDQDCGSEGSGGGDSCQLHLTCDPHAGYDCATTDSGATCECTDLDGSQDTCTLDVLDCSNDEQWKISCCDFDWVR